MLFNSLEFFVFFPIVVAIYYAVPHKYRWAVLLISSCYFYMVFVPVYILILGFTIVVDYFAGLIIEKSTGTRRKFMLIASIIANTGVLALFKYYNFLNDNLTFLLHGFKLDNPIPYLSILLPIGLSFHTFQAMSYTIEVFRGNQKAERNFGIYALYVMFFPQLVAGPIERPQNMLHQFHRETFIDYDRFAEGLKHIVWGLLKKVVIADRLAQYVNIVYEDPHNFNSGQLLVATVFFAFQIYCDFSGYSSIAIGTARILGIKLMVNFRRPYLSQNIREFWKRWHISLSSWFRDYLYIPLGGNRVPVSRGFINTMIVFLVSGLWHGASWNFVIWGGLHGFYLVFAKATESFREKLNQLTRLSQVPVLHSALQGLITFSLVTFAWIFFRAESFKDATYIVGNIFKFETFQEINIFKFPVDLYISIILVFLLLLVEWLEERSLISISFKAFPSIIRWSLYTASLIVLFILGIWESADFIYFQF